MSTKSEPKTTVKIQSSDRVAEAGANGIKEEDPDHAILSDPEDYLEENESLDMNLTQGDQKVWLVKLPRYLADKWTNPENLNGQQLGQVKIRTNSKKKLEVKLVLNNLPQTASIPSEYDLTILNKEVHNSYVFSEENLTRFKQELTEMGEMPNQPELPEFRDEDQEPQRPFKYFRVQKNGESLDGLEKKYVPFVKTIPKKTNLVGKIVHDCQIVPLKTDSRYDQMLVKRQTMTLTKERPKVTFLNEIPGVLQSQAGPSLSGRSNAIFLKNAAAKKAEGRAIRMPKKDLLDLLFRCFEEYEYWSMKGLKERTKQPETYLKESLESIANLIKKGPYTSKYNLKPEYKRLRDADRAARLGQNYEDEDDKKEEDDDDDMVDVI